MSRAHRDPRAGLTLLEVLVSLVIVSGLALVLLAANVPLSRASSEAGVAFDLDRSAARFLSDLRRELRRSGYNQADLQAQVAAGVDGGDPLTGPFSTVGPFRMRTGFGNTVNDANLAASSWSAPITYRLAASSNPGNYADGTPRYDVQRVQGGFTTVVLRHVQALSFVLFPQPEGEPAGTEPSAAHIEVSLTMRRENPAWTGTATGRFITRTYSEDIELLNKRGQ
ncbi:MAG: type II secretion system GspH family protein [Planctomycetes bacterium]|nr:type II secretion system GspH family protein [Planctomycetota bacterium]